MLNGQPKFWTSRVGRRLLVSVLLVSALVTFMISAVELSLVYHVQLKRMEQQLRDIETGYAESIGESLWVLDVEQIRIQARSIAALSDIRYVSVREIAGHNHFTGRHIVVGEPLAKNVLRREVVLSCRCDGKPRVIGLLRVDATLEPLQSEMMRYAWGILGGEAIKIFALVFVLMLMIHRQVTRRLLAFTGTIRGLMPGQSATRASFEHASSDEITELVSVFDNLQGRVREYIQSLQRAENRVAQREREFRSLLENLPDALLRCDTRCCIIYANPVCEALLGQDYDLLAGKTLVEVSDDPLYADFHEHIARTIATRIPAEVEQKVSIGVDRIRWYFIRIIVELDDEGEMVGVLAICSEITERKGMEEALHQQERRIQHLAYHDALTGLPNRVLLVDRLQQGIAHAKRSRELLVVAYIDLDNFKPINDAHGHAAGDWLLTEIAKRMTRAIRGSDTVARIGGDEFVLLLTGRQNLDDVRHALERLQRSTFEALDHDGRQFTVTTSIGVSVYPDDGNDPDILVRRADQAMYVAKKSGRNQHVFFGQEIGDAERRRSATVHELREALAQGHISVHFQPIVDLSTGGVYKAEALARWLHPERGMIPPAEFIALAEETGVIHALGDRIFELSIEMAAEWNRCCPVGAGGAPRQISINRSPRQFFQKNALDGWFERMWKMRVPGAMVAVEITEGLLLEDRTDVIDQLRRLKHMGISLSLDDFGTGYSALSYLTKFPIDTLKIDRSFVSEIDTSSSGRAIVESIIAMSRRLGIKTIAEGVETTHQQELLQAARCDMAQGYLFARPLAAPDFLAWVKAHGLRSVTA